MGLLSIKDLQPNMVLADDLKDRSGRLLMTKGTVLTDKYLKICKMWGIIEARIEGISNEDIHSTTFMDLDTDTITEVSESVRKRFALTDTSHPAIAELLRLCIDSTLEGKSCDTDHLKTTYLTVDQMRDFDRRKFSNIDPSMYINEDTKLSTLPDIYRRIMDAISKPSSSAYDIESVISKDTNLAARLLKIVNSAFYAYPFKIDSFITCRQPCRYKTTEHSGHRY